MFRKWLSCLSLLVCLSFILSMLFLNTLEAKAYFSGSVNCTGSISFDLHPISASSSRMPTTFTYSESGTSGTVNYANGTGTITNTGSDTMFYFFDLDIPVMSVLGNADDFTDYVAFNMYNLQVSSNVGSIANPYLYIGEDKTLINYCHSKSSWTWYDGSTSTIKLTCRPTIHCSFSYSKSAYTSINQSIPVTLTYSFTGEALDVSEDVFNKSLPNQSSDSGTHEKLDNLNETETAVKDSVTNPDPNGKGLFETISDFFGGFFSNIINSLISVFVPEDGFFSTWFDNLNTLLSDKLGMLYAPFDLLVSTLQSIYSADTSEVGIPFPGIQWGDTWLISPFTFTFDSLGESFTDFRDKVYFGTDTVLIFAFLVLLQKKVRLILEGHET